jgi:BASS family bile acid:Na+ symporter
MTAYTRKISLACAGLSAVVLLFSLAGILDAAWAAPGGLALAVFFALGLGAVPSLKGYQYTAWIVAAIVAGMLYPQKVLYWGEFDLRNPWLILIVVQFVMFGMGTQMRLEDFNGVIRTPRGVAVGLLCQFSIMPTMGWLLTRVFDFPLEIAAGIILIGSCSSGLASNVMAYIAKGNLALSITVTAVATLVAPLMTPLLMKFYASTLVELDFLAMMISIVKIVLAPIGAALLADYLRRAPASNLRLVRWVAAGCLAWLGYIAGGGWNWLSGVLPVHVLTSVSIFGFFAAAFVFGTAFHAVREAWPALQKLMPYLSMFGIVYFTTVTTAAGRDHLLQVGALLLIASILHNSAGYLLGYWFSRALGLDRNSARTMALEVGLQNGGMASGIAGEMGKLGTLGLASAVFSPWMNISGSILANIWGRNPVRDRERQARSGSVSTNEAL